MFNWLVKHFDAYQKLEKINEQVIKDKQRVSTELQNTRKRLDIESDRLKELEEKMKAGGQIISEGSSTLTFEIDPELKITVKSRINPEVVETLIDKDYIKSEFSEDEPTIQFAFILIANEATEQIIENVNNHEET